MKQGLDTMSQIPPVHSFRLDHAGLSRLFGEREAQIMDAVWHLEEATVQDVCDYLGDVNYKTIMTVMNRLVQKGALTRHRQGRAFVYRAIAERDAFLAEVFRSVAQGLVGDFGELALAQIVDTAGEVDLTLLDELEQMIQQKRAEATRDADS
jgi:predicted transcriptional regulator